MRPKALPTRLTKFRVKEFDPETEMALQILESVSTLQEFIEICRNEEARQSRKFGIKTLRDYR